MNKWFTYNSILLIIGLSTLVYSCGEKQEDQTRALELPYYNDAKFTPRWLKSDEVPYDFHQIPEFELINQNGQAVTEKDLDQKLTVVDFFFTTCPGICPKMTSNMMLVQEAFLEEEGVQIISYSVTPEVDSVEMLQQYAEFKGVDSSKWHLLTGDRDVIYDLGRYQYFIEEDLGLQKDPNDFIHTENFVLIDQNRRIRGIYNGLNKTSVRQLISDIKSLL